LIIGDDVKGLVIEVIAEGLGAEACRFESLDVKEGRIEITGGLKGLIVGVVLFVVEGSSELPPLQIQLR
jgi:hypothetical protein